jgi:hypothetical protein
MAVLMLAIGCRIGKAIKITASLFSFQATQIKAAEDD